MAVEWKVDFKRTAEYRFLPEAITILPEMNGRTELPQIDWLVADVLKRGQSTPVVVRNEGGKPVLVAGFSRWRAIKYINDNNIIPGVKLQLRATYMQLNEADAFLVNITENHYRNPTTPLDDAHNIQRLMNVYQMTEDQVIALYKPMAKTDTELSEARKWLKERVALIGLTDAAAEAVREGRVKPNAVQHLAKLSAKQQNAAAKKEEITKADVAPKKEKAATTAKVVPPPKLDVELLRRINHVKEDIEGVIYSDGYKEEYCEVEVKLLKNLFGYVEKLTAKA